MTTTQPGSDHPPADGARGQHPPAPNAPEGGLWDRARRLLVGPPRTLADRGVFHRMALAAFFAWVGLGADGLSSSAYGPEEAFRTLGEHAYLALGLAVLMAATVIIISLAYSRVIEEFPHGGGGYVVATKLLGPKAGVVSGCALLVDYVLTITISIAAAGDALFSFLPLEWHAWKLPAEGALLAGLTLLNLRGVRESVLVLTPVFLLFVLTHLVLIVGCLGLRAGHVPQVLSEARAGLTTGLGTLGVGGLLLRFLHAYSLGGGTYTGIEAVSNGLQIMREPHVKTGKRTMMYMASSLAFTATGLLVCYLLWGATGQTGKTLNAVLAERFADAASLGGWFVVVTLFAEGALLVVAAQAGFTDGPRVLANMAVDSWAPRRFASLSERLTTQNGVLLMAATAGAALLLTRGDVRYLVVMYSINVFLTFSMTTLSMCRLWLGRRRERPDWARRGAIHAVAFLMCATILGVTTFEKFLEGGWITLVITGVAIALCLAVRRHYDGVASQLARSFEGLERLPPESQAPLLAPDPAGPTAVVLVGAFNGFGVHTLFNLFRAFPGHYKGVVFAAVGVVDSGAFKGHDSVDRVGEATIAMLARYTDLARRLGVPATARFGVGIDAVDELEKVCLRTAREFPNATFFAGQVVFRRDTWVRRLLHNQTAYALQRRLQWAGLNVVILPARLAEPGAGAPR
jgi:amino acid transporter